MSVGLGDGLGLHHDPTDLVGSEALCAGVGLLVSVGMMILLGKGLRLWGLGGNWNCGRTQSREWDCKDGRPAVVGFRDESSVGQWRRRLVARVALAVLLAGVAWWTLQDLDPGYGFGAAIGMVSLTAVTGWFVDGAPVGAGISVLFGDRTLGMEAMAGKAGKPFARRKPNRRPYMRMFGRRLYRRKGVSKGPPVYLDTLGEEGLLGRKHSRRRKRGWRYTGGYTSGNGGPSRLTRRECAAYFAGKRCGRRKMAEHGRTSDMARHQMRVARRRGEEDVSAGHDGPEPTPVAVIRTEARPSMLERRRIRTERERAEASGLEESPGLVKENLQPDGSRRWSLLPSPSTPLQRPLLSQPVSKGGPQDDPAGAEVPTPTATEAACELGVVGGPGHWVGMQLWKWSKAAELEEEQAPVKMFQRGARFAGSPYPLAAEHTVCPDPTLGERAAPPERDVPTLPYAGLEAWKFTERMPRAGPALAESGTEGCCRETCSCRKCPELVVSGQIVQSQALLRGLAQRLGPVLCQGGPQHN